MKGLINKKTPSMHQHRKGNSETINKDVTPLYQKSKEVSYNKDSIEIKTNLKQDKNTWELPIALEATELERFPSDLFPKWLNDFIKAVSIETQTPIDTPALASLATLSTVLNKQYDIQVKGNWKEYLNIYTALALESGNLKSPVFNQFIEPISEYEKEKRVELTPIVVSEREELQAKEKHLTRLKDDYSKSPNKEAMNDIKLLSKEISMQEKEKTVIPKIIASDATPEKLAMIMEEHNEKIALLSAEGAEVFEMIAGRYGEKPNQDLYLKSFSSETFDVERTTREGVHLDAPSMVIGLFVQPSVIQNIPNEFTDRGLTQRFLYSFPKSFLGRRDVDPLSVPDVIEEVYVKNIKLLLQSQDNEIETLSLSLEAWTYLVEQRKWVELKFLDKNINGGMVGWLSKLVGNIIRISGILHVIENVEQFEELPLEISKETLERAFLLRDYLISHAEKGFNIMGVNQKVDDSYYLLEAIKKECIEQNEQSVTYRDVFESVKRRFKTAAIYREKLAELEELYWIKQYKSGKSFISLNPNISLNCSQ